MMTIKTKENASLLMAFVSAFIVAIVMAACDIVWWLIAIVALGVFVVIAIFSLYLIKSYVAYNVKDMNIVFDSDKLLALLQKTLGVVSSKASSLSSASSRLGTAASTLGTVGKLLENYDGMMLGMELKK